MAMSTAPTKEKNFIKLNTEEVKVNGTLLGLIHRWGHPSGVGNKLYLVEILLDGTEPIITTSGMDGLRQIHDAHGLPVPGARPGRVIRDAEEEHEHGFVQRQYDRTRRANVWAWRTKDGRLTGEAKDKGQALEALIAAVQE
jgi:hypothetical protein